MRVGLMAFVMVTLAGTAGAVAKSPLEVFARPPREAHAGVWWHWMGSQVTREGVLADLDWMSRMGITSATIFGLCNSCTPWAKRIANVPTDGLRPYSDAWWKLVKLACAEGRRRGIDIGLHNCPGYTSTGGKWIPSRLSMRRLVFGVTNAAEQVSTASDALYPVYNEESGRLEKPACAARRTDYQRIGKVNGLEIGHIPMGAFVQPTDWDSFGLECDKMNPEAVDFHLDHILTEFKRHLGPDLPAAGLQHVLLDSYEAGVPNWTPRMREEFEARRGYDCLRFLPILGGYTNAYTVAECRKFRADFDRTVSDLYRDVLYRRMAARLRAEGLSFSNEPYGGPFDTFEVARYVDRIMTEFWYVPGRPEPRSLGSHDRFHDIRRMDGTRHNIVEAEAFTGQPGNCRWTETPALLKPCGDRAWLNGVNRFVLHTCPLQPWGDDVRPGVTMGRWGVHFGRTQTWAESGRAWFDYVARSQALLQWGEPSGARLDVPCAQIARQSEGRTVHFLVNEGETNVTLRLTGDGIWLDPVDGRRGNPPVALVPHQSGFWVVDAESSPRQEEGVKTDCRRVSLPDWTPALGDWTASDDSAVRYHSGARTYRTTFAVADASRPYALDLGEVLGATAAVSVNGMDCGTVWCAPWRVRIPAGVLKAADNLVEVEVVNVWANRLIGDEQEPKDMDFAPAPFAGTGEMLLKYPDWFEKGIKSRPSSGRKCFTTWNYFTAKSPLVPSGLVGPVVLQEGSE